MEYAPADPSRAYLLDTYKLRIDEERTPEWFDEDMKEAVAGKMAEIVKAMIVPKSGMVLLGGAWIVPPDVEVSVGPMTRIVANSGTVTANSGTVTANSGTVTRNSGTGTVTANYGTVTRNYGTVTRNSGTGTVTANYGTVTANSGKVVQNITTYGKGVIVSGAKAPTK